MKRVVIKSNFFSCDIKMTEHNVEKFLKGVKRAWHDYKWHSVGNTDSHSDLNQKTKVSDDYLTCKIKPC